MTLPKFAVVGASSFSGHAFIRHITGLGHRAMPFARPRDNLNINPGAIAEDIVTGGASHVVNFAALNMVAESWTHYADYYRTNVTGVATLCDELRKRHWDGRFVQVSTPEVYGARGGLIKEGAEFMPSTPYAVSRAAIDMHLRALHATYGFRVLFTRSCNVYGPGQQIYRLIPKAVLSILRGEKFKLHGGGVSRRAWLHIDDATEAIRLVALSGEEGEDYHVSTESYFAIRDLVKLICLNMKVGMRDVVEVGDERPGKDMEYQLDDARIRKELGWSDRMEFTRALKSTIDWYMARSADFAGQSLEYTHRG